MNFTKQDLAQVENLVRLLKKAKFELEGLEVLAAADMFRWVSKLATEVPQDIKKQEEEAKFLEAAEDAKMWPSPVITPSTPVPPPVVSPKAAKKSVVPPAPVKTPVRKRRGR